MEDTPKKGGLEQTVVNILEIQSRHGVDQNNMLIMLSLINLMGIVNVMQKNTGEETSQVLLAKKDDTLVHNTNQNPNADLMQMVQQAASGNINPAQLIGMLGQQGGQVPNAAALMGLLSQLMPPPPPPPPLSPSPSDKQRGYKQGNKELNKDNNPPEYKHAQMEPEKTTGTKNVLKWDPRLG